MPARFVLINCWPVRRDQAWALIGYKGAPPGTALTTMGARSTLLRLEARFARVAGPAGAVSLCAKKEGLTSIADVVTGGNQDCAVGGDEADEGEGGAGGVEPAPKGNGSNKKRGAPAAGQKKSTTAAKTVKR